MRRITAILLCGMAVLGFAHIGETAGSAYRLYGYALAGANPRAVFVVIDSNGNGVKNVPMTIACTTGTLDVVAGNTGADGTLTVQQSGAALGSQITATCASVSFGSPFTITTSNSADRVNVPTPDPTYFWFDESRRLVNLVSVTSGKNVLTLPGTSSFRFLPQDSTTNGRDITTSQDWNVAVQQGTTGPIQVEVYQGTFQNGDYMRLYDSYWGRWLDVVVPAGSLTANGFGLIYFSSTPPAHYLTAYAVDGASPTVCAIVTDANGVGVSGITVNIAATAGTFPGTSDVTNDGGRAYFYQQGGTLGNTITVSCSALIETSPVQIITGSSQALQSTDKVFSWFSRKSRRMYTAVVTRQTNVLVAAVPASTWPVNYFTNGADPNQRPAQSSGAGAYTDQTSQQPAMAAVPNGSTMNGDLFYLWNLPTLYHYNNYQCVVTLPANETQYLLAFASGGANPTIWAAVTDATGNAVKGVTVNFALQGSGTLGTATGATSWNGMITNSLTGAGAIGNTVTVTATGLGSITILTSNSQAAVSSDRVYSWYDPETHKIIGAVVTLASNVMTTAGTNVGGSAVKRSTGNNTPTLGYSFGANNTSQTAAQPFIGHIGFGTVGAGDFIRITQSSTSNTYDTHIIAAADPAKFLVAFAKGGVDPTVWAVVMDNQGNGLENEAVTFASPNAGTMSLGTTVTGYGGYVVSTHTSGLLGNTLTVSAVGLPPVTIYTATAPAAGGYNDNGVAWYDASRLKIWGSSFDEANHVILASQSWYDWGGYSPAGPYVTYSSGALKINKAQAYDMNAANRKINPLAQWTIAFGTANAGDECWVDLALIKSYIHINTVKPSYLRACANPNANPLVRAMVVDAHGVGIPNVPINFTASSGFMSGVLNYGTTTGLDGSISSGQSSGVLGDVITVSSAGYPDVQIQTSASGIVANNSPAVFWYDPNSRCLNSLMIQQPWHNVIVTAQANILFTAADRTANNKTLAISGPKEDFVQSPTYGFVAPGTSGAGDQIVVQNNSVWGTNDGLLTLPADLSRYLWAFAAGGANPKVWAAVTDANGNGIGGVPVHIKYPGPITVNLATDTTGVTTNASGIAAVGNNISITADSIANTINVTVTNLPVAVDTYSRTMGWYDQISRIGYGAFVSVPNNILASAGTSAACTPMDTTPNGLAFALGAASQQTAAAPASVSVANGTQGQGDIIQFDEATATAAPDLQLSINVPTSGIYSSLAAGPDPVITGNYISVTMTVFNNGTPDATSVSPTALSIAGGATYVSGPSPAFWAAIPGGQSKTFNWTYLAAAPGGVTLTGHALGIDSYTLNDLASADTNSNPVLVRDPVPPVLVSTLAVPGAQQLSNSYIYVTMTVTNNSAAEVASPLNVSPTALTLAGSATLISGPTPPNWDIPGQGGTHDFVWEYQVTAPAGVTFTGQAYTLNPFNLTGVTSTATQAFVAVRDPMTPVLTASLAVPSTQITNSYFYVTMTVTNSSAAEVASPLNVSPTALALAGAATLISGPVPPNWDIPGQGGTHDFVWEYQATTPTGSTTGVTLTGQAYTLNPFNLTGVTSTAANAFVAVRNPHQPVLTPSLQAAPAVRSVGQTFTVTMSVLNNSDTEVPNPLSVSPTALTITGPATIQSGPVPAVRVIPRNTSQSFTWLCATTAPGSVTITGKAYTLNPFDLSGVTSTAASSNVVTVQSPAGLSATLAGPASAEVERLREFTLTMAVMNFGQAAAVSVTPSTLVCSVTDGANAALQSGPEPAMATISGGGSQVFTWTYTAASQVGTLQFSGSAGGHDANSWAAASSAAAGTGVITVIQGALNLDSITSTVSQVYQGQKALLITMQAHNTSQAPVTLTAASLSFTNTLVVPPESRQDGFAITPATDNPAWVAGRADFTLHFSVNVLKTAKLGHVTIDGAIAGDQGPAGTMSANHAKQTIDWEVLEPKNQLRQNYPNPLRISKNAFTTFEFVLEEDVKTTLKLYNLAGELVAVLVDGSPGIGRHTVFWYGDNGDLGQRGKTVGSGVYLAVLRIGNFQEIKKAVVIR